MSAICDLVLNPSKINLSTLNAVNHNCALLWQSQIVIEDVVGRLYFVLYKGIFGVPDKGQTLYV